MPGKNTIKNMSDVEEFAKIKRIVSSIGVEQYLYKNDKWQQIYEKISGAYTQITRKEAKEDIRFRLLLTKIRDDINEIILNYSVVSPLKLKNAVDKIVEENEMQQHDEQANTKAAVTIIMAIILFIIKVAINHKKNENSSSLIKLIEKYANISELNFE